MDQRILRSCQFLEADNSILLLAYQGRGGRYKIGKIHITNCEQITSREEFIAQRMIRTHAMADTHKPTHL